MQRYESLFRLPERKGGKNKEALSVGWRWAVLWQQGREKKKIKMWETAEGSRPQLPRRHRRHHNSCF